LSGLATKSIIRHLPIVRRFLREMCPAGASGAELTDHLGYEKGDPAGRGSGNSRNGSSAKMVLTQDGEIEIVVLRDRTGSFEPQLIAPARSCPRRAAQIAIASALPGRPAG
jgi:transposase-like protein